MYDVNKNQNFIPFCKTSKILQQQDDYIIAQLELDFFGIKSSLTTKNIIKKMNQSLWIYRMVHLGLFMQCGCLK